MLTPEERSARARIGAYALHATHDSRETTAAARAAVEAKFLDEVDPKRELDEDERLRRAGHAKSRDYARLSYLAAKARAARSATGAMPVSADRYLHPVGDQADDEPPVDAMSAGTALDHGIRRIVRDEVGRALDARLDRLEALLAGLEDATRPTFNLGQAAAYLSVGKDTVRRLIDDGELQTIDYGTNRVVIARHQLDGFIHRASNVGGSGR